MENLILLHIPVFGIMCIDEKNKPSLGSRTEKFILLHMAVCDIYIFFPALHSYASVYIYMEEFMDSTGYGRLLMVLGAASSPLPLQRIAHINARFGNGD